MAIVNRDLDSSQQTAVLNCAIYSSLSAGASAGVVTPGVQTGKTYVLANIGSPAQLVAAAAGAYGVSGSLATSLWIYRFAGGFTSIAVGQTLAVQGYGTSGLQGISCFAGSTFLLQNGDQVALYAQGANAACDSITVSLVVKALQDIKTSFGV